MNNKDWLEPKISVWEHDLEMGKMYFENRRLKIISLIEMLIILGFILHSYV